MTIILLKVKNPSKCEFFSIHNNQIQNISKKRYVELSQLTRFSNLLCTI